MSSKAKNQAKNQVKPVQSVIGGKAANKPIFKTGVGSQSLSELNLNLILATDVEKEEYLRIITSRDFNSKTQMPVIIDYADDVEFNDRLFGFVEFAGYVPDAEVTTLGSVVEHQGLLLNVVMAISKTVESQFDRAVSHIRLGLYAVANQEETGVAFAYYSIDIMPLG